MAEYIDQEEVMKTSQGFADQSIGRRTVVSDIWQERLSSECLCLRHIPDLF